MNDVFYTFLFCPFYTMQCTHISVTDEEPVDGAQEHVENLPVFCRMVQTCGILLITVHCYNVI